MVSQESKESFKLRFKVKPEDHRRDRWSRSSTTRRGESVRNRGSERERKEERDKGLERKADTMGKKEERGEGRRWTQVRTNANRGQTVEDWCRCEWSSFVPGFALLGGGGRDGGGGFLAATSRSEKKPEAKKKREVEWQRKRMKE